MIIGNLLTYDNMMLIFNLFIKIIQNFMAIGFWFFFTIMMGFYIFDIILYMYRIIKFQINCICYQVDNTSLLNKRQEISLPNKLQSGSLALRRSNIANYPYNNNNNRNRHCRDNIQDISNSTNPRFKRINQAIDSFYKKFSTRH